MKEIKNFVFAALVLSLTPSLAHAQTQNVNIQGTVKDALLLDCSRGNERACDIYEGLKHERVVRVDNVKEALLLDCSKGDERACNLYEDLRYKEKADKARARIEKFSDDLAQ